MSIIICGDDPVRKDDDSDCPNKDQHTPVPRGYGAWFTWAASASYRGRRQKKCPGCGLYKIWTGASL